MKRLLLSVLALAAACGETARVPPAPLDQFYRPTGLAVHGERLLVASSNSDLRFDFDEGGSVISVAPPAGGGPVTRLSAVRIPSFAGELAVADAAACGLDVTLAVVPVRGNDAVLALDLGADGALSCGAGCELPLSGPFGDPNAIAIACDGSRARAFVGHLRGVDAVAWVSAVDLGELLLARAGTPTGAPVVENGAVGVGAAGAGPVRGMAYDALRQRLWVTGVPTSAPTPLRAIELGGGCSIAREPRDGGCQRLSVRTTLPAGLELRGIALSNVAPGAPAPDARRVYLTARRYDPDLAVPVGGRNDDQGGVLVVAELVEGAAGVELRPARAPVLMGDGAAAVAVLPARPGLRDVVAVVASDGGDVVIFDDETGEQRRFGRDPATGAPLLGHTPWGLAVQPLSAGSAVCGGSPCARVFVSSFGDSFVTAIDVPLDAPMTAEFAVADPLARRIGPEVP